ncbi:MAG TPA: ribosome maturation factor RimM [Terriglobales bacterium]|nr:ribosome maturation factor RimM [Terriglobales bacterium]
MAAGSNNMILVGAITGAHGVKGEVKVKSFTAEPASIAAYGPLFDESGRRRFDLSLSGKTGETGKDVLVGRIQGVADRNAAEALKGQRLYVARDQLPAGDDPDEFYLADLIGLAVLDAAGASLGRVTDVANYGAGDVLMVEGGAKGAFDLPFAKAFVPKIDLAAKALTVALPDDFFEAPVRPSEEEMTAEDAAEDDEVARP